MATNNNLEDFVNDLASAIRCRSKDFNIMNVQDMSERIRQIGSVEEKDVNFYDYDGVRLFSYSKEEANSLTELPTPPLKDDLNFTGWTYSLQAIKDQVGKCDIGALYSYNNPDYFVALTILVPSDNFTIKFKDAFWSVDKLDWGDGNIIENPSSTVSFPSHTYLKKGVYTIKSTRPLGANQGSVNGNPISPISVLQQVFIKSDFRDTGGYSDIGMNTFQEAPNFIIATDLPLDYGSYDYSKISFCIVPSISVTPSYIFRGCSNLKKLCLGSSITKLPKNIMIEGSHKELCLPPYLETVEDSVFSLKKGRIIFPPTLKSLSESFVNLGADVVLDFSHLESIPTIGTYGLINCSSFVTIIVPDNLYDEWRTTGNWSKHAKKIVKASEYTE